jgi:hypothetical protein
MLVSVLAYRCGWYCCSVQTAMYIVAIAWIYVVFMMSITEQSATAGVMTFLLYGVFPLSIILYLMGMPERKRRRRAAENSARGTETTSPSVDKASD